jgi:NADH-quinone oxidoreductase subunit C
MLVELAGVDYLSYGMDEWETARPPTSGFSRGVVRGSPPVSPDTPKRFAVAYHLLSLSLNQRLRVRCYAEPGDPPKLPSVTRSGRRPTGSSARPSTCSASCSRATPTCGAS